MSTQTACACGGQPRVYARDNVDDDNYPRGSHKIMCDDCGIGTDWEYSEHTAWAVWDKLMGQFSALQERCAKLEAAAKQMAETLLHIRQGRHTGECIYCGEEHWNFHQCHETCSIGNALRAYENATGVNPQPDENE